MKYLRRMFDPRMSWGYLIITFSCGIVAGLSPLWESEGDRCAHWCFNDVFRHPEFIPDLLFYDRACFRRRHLISQGDTFWNNCILMVDRYAG